MLSVHTNCQFGSGQPQLTPVVGLKVTVVVAPFTICACAVTSLPLTNSLTLPSTTVVEPSMSSALMPAAFLPPPQPSDGIADFSTARPAPLRNVLTELAAVALTSVLTPVVLSTENHSQLAPPWPSHQSRRSG